MEEYQERVEIEKRELDKKIGALEAFNGSERFRRLSMAEQMRMTEQLEVMEEYSAILGRRIENF